MPRTVHGLPSPTGGAQRGHGRETGQRKPSKPHRWGATVCPKCQAPHSGQWYAAKPVLLSQQNRLQLASFCSLRTKSQAIIRRAGGFERLGAGYGQGGELPACPAFSSAHICISILKSAGKCQKYTRDKSLRHLDSCIFRFCFFKKHFHHLTFFYRVVL